MAAKLLREKGRLFKAPFLLVLAVLFLPALAHPTCRSAQAYELARVQHVIDGDTLVLNGGRKVRLIGINTPEVAKPDQPGEPLAYEARERVRAFVETSPDIRLQLGAEPEDRYGRLLAHVFDDRGQSLEELLLREGLGRHIVIGRNDFFSDCFSAAEKLARAQGKGVWALSYYRVADASSLKEGFQLAQGRVMSVSTKSARNWWFDLDTGLSLLIRKRDQERFDLDFLRALKGKGVEVRGWVIDRRGQKGNKGEYRGRWMMPISHPDAIAILPRK